MIEVCSASMQKSVQELDNATAEGTGAFDQVFSMIEGLADRGINVTTTRKLLKIKDRKKVLEELFQDKHCTRRTL